MRQEFAAHAALLADMGVDALLPEYVGHIADCVAAAAACERTDLPVFLGVRHIRADGTMQYGERLEDLVAALDGYRVDAILLMCGRAEDTSASLPRLREVFDGAIGAYCNAGYYPTSPVLAAAAATADQEADSLHDADYYPARMAAFAREWKAMGAQIIGGCCATGPEHVQAMRSVVIGPAHPKRAAT